MTHFGYAPTIDIPRLASAPQTTASVPVTPGTVSSGTPVTYFGSSLKDHGQWTCDGECPCGCPGLRLWRQERDGLHRLVHVSAANVSRGRA